MKAAISLLLGAVTAGWIVPRHLCRLNLRRRDPRTLIVAWLLAMAAVIVAGFGGAALLLTRHQPTTGSVTWFFTLCWSALQHAVPLAFGDFGSLLGVVLLAALTARLGIVAFRDLRPWRQAHRERLAALRLVARTDEGRPQTLWLAHDRPLAFSLAGRPGTVVATDGLHRHLPRASVAAVLAHERAHLRGHHHLLMAVTGVLRRALPFVPLFRRAPAALRDLVELAADMAAAKTCGPAAVRRALLTVTGHGAPDIALAMAKNAVGLRLARLQPGTRYGGGVRRALSCCVAGTAVAAFPFVAGAMILPGVVAVCRMTS